MPNFAVHKLKRHFSANCPTKGCNRTTCFSPAEVLGKALFWKSQNRSTSFKVLIHFRLLYYFFIEMFLYQTWKQYIFLICTREIMLSILEVMHRMSYTVSVAHSLFLSQALVSWQCPLRSQSRWETPSWCTSFHSILWDLLETIVSFWVLFLLRTP